MSREPSSGRLYRVLAVFVAVAFLQPTDGYRILAVQPIAAKSHWNFMSAVLRSLSGAGHPVTVFTPFPEGDRPNYTEVDTTADHRNMYMLERDMAGLIDTLGDPVAATRTMLTFNQLLCDTLYANQRFSDAATPSNNDTAFDAIVVEPLMYDCMSHLADRLRLPVVYVLPYPMVPFVERPFTGHVSNPAYVSELFAPQAVPATFAQRFANAVRLATTLCVAGYYGWWLRLTDPRPYDRSPSVTPSLIYQNSHFATEASKPVPPNLIYVGGIHLKPPKTLPKDISDFIDGSPGGVIYFSFGSATKSSSLPVHVETVFLETFARIPQRVLWKYDGEIKDKPDNVLVRRWFPQREVLLHPKVKLFISHGGLSGIYETLDAGVPVLGFPLFFDQPRNVDHLVRNGMAISMDLFAITERTLSDAISDLIDNKTYAKNAASASRTFKDRPMTPEQSVVYWTEYVIRHKGAPHLLSSASNLAWYQYLLIDVMIVAFVSIVALVLAAYTMFKLIRENTVNVFKTPKVKVQ